MTLLVIIHKITKNIVILQTHFELKFGLKFNVASLSLILPVVKVVSARRESVA